MQRNKLKLDKLNHSTVRFNGINPLCYESKTVLKAILSALVCYTIACGGAPPPSCTTKKAQGIMGMQVPDPAYVDKCCASNDPGDDNYNVIKDIYMDPRNFNDPKVLADCKDCWDNSMAPEKTSTICTPLPSFGISPPQALFNSIGRGHRNLRGFLTDSKDSQIEALASPSAQPSNLQLANSQQAGATALTVRNDNANGSGVGAAGRSLGRGAGGGGGAFGGIGGKGAGALSFDDPSGEVGASANPQGAGAFSFTGEGGALFGKGGGKKKSSSDGSSNSVVVGGGDGKPGGNEGQGDASERVMMSEDPEDYFALIGLDDNLFKRVEARYRSIETGWKTADIRKPKK